MQNILSRSILLGMAHKSLRMVLFFLIKFAFFRYFLRMFSVEFKLIIGVHCNAFQSIHHQRLLAALGKKTRIDNSNQFSMHGVGLAYYICNWLRRISTDGRWF